MGPIGFPETSVRNYHYSLCNNPEERSCQLLRGGSLKSHPGCFFLCFHWRLYPVSFHIVTSCWKDLMWERQKSVKGLLTAYWVHELFNDALYLQICRSQWPRGLSCKCTAARLLISWVRIPPWAWMSVCCECCVLSGRGLCDELITRPEESYWLCFVVVCDLEPSWMRRPRPTRVQ